ncbi:hypothetical protein ACFCT7_02785 [Fulvivirgaceae bacterium LMO-SS25]
MKNSDTYTKTILTIIALCLMLLVFQNVSFVNTAQANSEIPKSYGLIPLNEDGSINVRLVEQNRIDVNIRSIGGNYIYGSTLSVKLTD